MNSFTQQEPRTPWENRQHIDKFVSNPVGVERSASFHENSCLSFAVLCCSRSTCVNTLQQTWAYSANKIAQDSGNGNDLSILLLLIVQLAFLHGMPIFSRKNRSLKTDSFLVTVDWRSIFRASGYGITLIPIWWCEIELPLTLPDTWSPGPAATVQEVSHFKLSLSCQSRPAARVFSIFSHLSPLFIFPLFWGGLAFRVRI